MPSVRVPSEAEICRVPGVDPLPGVTLSQAELLVAVKLSAPPPPVLVTLTDAGEGFVPLPSVALKESGAVESDKIGCVTAVKFTAEMFAPFTCSGALMGMNVTLDRLGVTV